MQIKSTKILIITYKSAIEDRGWICTNKKKAVPLR